MPRNGEKFSNERVSEGDTFRCRKCRIYLFSFGNLTTFHKKIEPVDQCSSWYVNCDDDIRDNDFMISVKESIHKSQWTEGKIYCHKCTSRLGAFNITQGVKCSCFAFVIPAVWIQKCKVDQKVVSDVDLSFSYPMQRYNPNGDGSGILSGQSSQTGLQSSQTGSQTTQTGLQSSQTGPQTSQTGLQSSQTGSQTSQTGLQNFICQSETCSGTVSDLFGAALDHQLLGPSKMTHAFGSQLDSSGLQIAAVLQSRGSQTDFTCSCGSDTQTDKVTSQVVPHCEPTFEILDNPTNCDPKERCCYGHNYQKQTSFLNGCRRRANKVKITPQNEENIDDKNLHNTRNANRSHLEEEDQEESDDIPEHLICPVCLDLLYEPLFCPCTHVFCDSCLRILNSKSKRRPKCPLCRKSLHYVYPAIELRKEIKKTFSKLYRNRHRTERRAVHRRFPLPSSRLRSRRKIVDNLRRNLRIPFGVLVFFACVLSVSLLCLVILFIFCPPTSNRCVTVIGYE